MSRQRTFVKREYKKKYQKYNILLAVEDLFENFAPGLFKFNHKFFIQITEMKQKRHLGLVQKDEVSNVTV